MMLRPIRKTISSVTGTESVIRKTVPSSSERLVICQDNRVSSEIISEEFLSYRGNINVLEHPYLDEANFKAVYEVGRSFADIYSQFNFHGKKILPPTNNKDELIVSYGNPNVSLALYMRDGKKCLMLAVSGGKPDRNGANSPKTKMENLIQEVNNDDNNNLHITLKELLRIHNIHELSIVTHHSTTTDKVIEEKFNSINTDPEIRIYGCSEPTLYRELTKCVRDDGATVMGSVHFSLIMQPDNKQSNLQIHSLHSQSSCCSRCQLMYNNGQYKPEHLGLKISASDIQKEKVKDKRTRSVKVTPLSLPTQPAQLLEEINKIENVDERLTLLAQNSNKSPQIAKAFENLVSKKFLAIFEKCDNEYIALLKVASGETDIKSILNNLSMKDKVANKIIINRLLELAIEQRKWLSLDELLSCNTDKGIDATQLISCLCEKSTGSKSQLNSTHKTNDKILNEYICQSIDKDIIHIINCMSEFGIQQISFILNKQWNNFFDASFAPDVSSMIQAFISDLNLSSANQKAVKDLKNVLHGKFDLLMDSISRLTICAQAAHNNESAIDELVKIFLEELSEETKDLIKLAEIDLSEQIKKWVTTINHAEILNNQPLIYVDYLETIQNSIMGNHYVNQQNSLALFNIIGKQANLDKDDDIVKQNEVISGIISDINEVSTQLADNNARIEVLNQSIKSANVVAPVQISTNNNNHNINKSNKSKPIDKNKKKDNSKDNKNALKASENLRQSRLNEINELKKQSKELTITKDKYQNLLSDEERKLNSLIKDKQTNIIKSYITFVNLPEGLVQTLINNNSSNILGHVLQALLLEVEATECLLYFANKPKKAVEARLNMILNMCNQLERYASTAEKYVLCEGMNVQQLAKNTIYFNRTEDGIEYTVISPCGKIINDTVSSDFSNMSLAEISNAILPLLSKRDHIIRSDAETIAEIKALKDELVIKLDEVIKENAMKKQMKKTIRNDLVTLCKESELVSKENVKMESSTYNLFHNTSYDRKLNRNTLFAAASHIPNEEPKNNNQSDEKGNSVPRLRFLI